ncbi:hypothetical protein GF367_02375 [Candidatus Woesearchaeota archaeon]|nr:hypothetical protein [Candidatus Woesearchaeota archaeon]
MDIHEHKSLFEDIAEKYGLKNEEKAGEIADFLVTHPAGKVAVQEFAEQFDMAEEDAETFLKFIDRGLRYKEHVMDRK